MIEFSDIKGKYIGNKNLINNVLGSFLVRGFGFLVSFALFPLYLNYFDDNTVLGCWFTMCSVLSWIQVFDLGIGNGLRNHLTADLSLKNYESARQYISSSYILMGGVTVFISFLAFIISRYIDWNSVFNISEQSISPESLRKGVVIALCGVLCFFFLKLIISILYALPKSALPNFLNLLSTVLLLIFLWVYDPTGDVERDFVTISWVQAVTGCLPLLVATIIVFAKDLKECLPSFKYFRWDKATGVLSLGILFLVLYIKIFSIAGTFVSLALIPVWSAVTKAFVEKRYDWIIKLVRFLYFVAGIAVLFQLAIIPFLDPILEFWLGEKAIEVNLSAALLFALLGCVMIWVSVLTSVVNGLGTLKCQLYGFLWAVLFKVVVIVLFSSWVPWTIVITATIVGLLPYCVWQPVVMSRQLKMLNKESFQNG